MIRNSGYDPFAKSFNWTNTLGELATIGTDSEINRIVIRLEFAPRPPSTGTPQTVRVWFDTGGGVKGLELVETAGAPTANQFRVDYGFYDSDTGSPKGIATGLVLFNIADDTKDVIIEYENWGSPLSVENLATLTSSSSSLEIGSLHNLLFQKPASPAFPYLSTWQDHSAISVLNWPDLQPALANYTNIINGNNSFNISSYANNGSGKTRLTLVVNADNQKIADSMFAKAVLKGNGVVDWSDFWHPLHIPAIIGSIPIGLYNVLDVDPISLTIDIDLNYPSGSSAGFYNLRPFADPTDSNNARWSSISGLILRNLGGGIGSLFTEIDTLQSHKHSDSGHTHSDAWSNTNFAQVSGNFFWFGGGSTGTGYANLGDPTDSGTGTPRHSQQTRDRSLVLPIYIFGGSYNL